jgi:hypothetical protein
MGIFHYSSQFFFRIEWQSNFKFALRKKIIKIPFEIYTLFLTSNLEKKNRSNAGNAKDNPEDQHK